MKEINSINQKELEGNGGGSWHDTYKGEHSERRIGVASGMALARSVKDESKREDGRREQRGRVQGKEGRC